MTTHRKGEQSENRDGQGDNRQDEFHSWCSGDKDEKLELKADDEEGGKLEEAHEDLVAQVRAPDCEVCADTLEGVPAELGVEWPEHQCHGDGACSNDGRNDDRVDVREMLDVRRVGVAAAQGVGELSWQDGGVDEDGTVEEAEDGECHDVLVRAAVERDTRFEEDGEDEKAEVGCDRLELWVVADEVGRREVARVLRENKDERQELWLG